MEWGGSAPRATPEAEGFGTGIQSLPCMRLIGGWDRGSGFTVYGSGLMVYLCRRTPEAERFGIQGSGFRVYGLPLQGERFIGHGVRSEGPGCCRTACISGLGCLVGQMLSTFMV